MKQLYQKAEVLHQKAYTNQMLLDKLKAELAEAKFKYTQLKTELSTAENDSIKLRKLKESESVNFGEIVDDLISIVFESSWNEEGQGKKEIESLQTFSGLVEKISGAVEKSHNFKIDFTFMNVEECDRGRLSLMVGQDQLQPLIGENFKKSKLL